MAIWSPVNGQDWRTVHGNSGSTSQVQVFGWVTGAYRAKLCKVEHILAYGHVQLGHSEDAVGYNCLTLPVCWMVATLLA